MLLLKSQYTLMLHTILNARTAKAVLFYRIKIKDRYLINLSFNNKFLIVGKNKYHFYLYIN